KVDVTKEDKTLFRFVDVDVEPGHTYEYLITLRMANPNFKRDKEVASLKYAKIDELWSPPKYNPAVKVAYPVRVYAVDERALDSKWKPLLKGKTPVPSSSEVALQLHRWFDRVEVKNQGSIRLGDWLVAERVLAQRGEFLKWDVEAQVPKWVEGEKTF